MSIEVSLPPTVTEVVDPEKEKEKIINDYFYENFYPSLRFPADID